MASISSEKKITTKPGMPFADTRMAVYLSKQIDALAGVKTQREIAFEIGYEKPNMISMFKRGEAKVPLDKIPALAKALHVDPVHLFRMAVEQQWPALKDVIGGVFNNLASDNEMEVFLNKWRERSQERDPSPSAAIDEVIDEALDKLYGKAKS